MITGPEGPLFRHSDPQIWSFVDMSHQLSKRHLPTFARLREAVGADIASLQSLEHQVAHRSGSFDWSSLIAGGETIVITAREGESLVGAAIVSHRSNTATAKLLWLGVCPSARRRGVGTVLLDEAMAGLRDRGAAVVIGEAPTGDAALTRLLLSSGFQCNRTTAYVARYKRLLWRSSHADTVVRLSFA